VVTSVAAAQPEPRVAPGPAEPDAASVSEPDRRASEAFDAGVASFERADYRAAALAFLQADELAPNADVLSNAIAAARRANDHLLVIAASQRAIAREAAAPELAANAREALTHAERYVSRLELGCRAELTCSVTLDGTEVGMGTHYALPGMHEAVATSRSGRRASQRFETAPGSTYRIELEPVLPQPQARRTPSQVARRRTEPTPPSHKPLSPAAFWGSLGATGALAAVTTWSGMDVVQKRDELPSRPSEQQAAHDADRIQRTDILLVTTVLVATLTTYAGIALVDWGSTPAAAMQPLGITF
jgi:hypothetical protein